jgi:hypothetical protein
VLPRSVGARWPSPPSSDILSLARPTIHLFQPPDSSPTARWCLARVGLEHSESPEQRLPGSSILLEKREPDVMPSDKDASENWRDQLVRENARLKEIAERSARRRALAYLRRRRENERGVPSGRPSDDPQKT